MDLDSYYHNRILRWAGHIARVPVTGRRGICLLGVAHLRLMSTEVKLILSQKQKKANRMLTLTTGSPKPRQPLAL